MKYYQLAAFTLFEVLLAWSLFVIVVMGLAYAQLTALKGLRHAYQQQQAQIRRDNQREHQSQTSY